MNKTGQFQVTSEQYTLNSHACNSQSIETSKKHGKDKKENECHMTVAAKKVNDSL